jgi:hypothetical protein
MARRHAREHQRHSSDDGDGDVKLMLGARATAKVGSPPTLLLYGSKH